MSDKIKRFFECLIPVTACNLKCGYCYVIQRDNRKMKMPELRYSPKIIGEGLRVERLGGICYFSICGAGETLLPRETIEIVYELLKNGHYVNLTTNGTITKRFDEILQFPEEYLERLHFAFSFHYNELVRLHMLNTFFGNVKKVRKAGCSFLVQINLCDEYLNDWDEIKNICIKEVGAPPQVAATRNENNNEGRIEEVEFMTKLSKKEYIEKGQEFNSPLFDFTVKNFNVRRREFCYAGDWSGTLDLGTGILSKCYGPNKQDIFKDVKKPIDFSAIGKCDSAFCMNSSHFMSLGIIPEIETPTYASLRNREEAGWYSEKMNQFLSQKLSNNNKEYTEVQKKRAIIKTSIQININLLKRKIKLMLRKVTKRIEK